MNEGGLPDRSTNREGSGEPWISTLTSATQPTNSISVFAVRGEDQIERRHWEFDIPVRIEPDLASITSFGALLGMSVAVPSIAVIVASPSLTETAKWILGLVALGASIFFGMLAAAGIKRPIPKASRSSAFAA